jgi:transposase-like protein
MLLTRLQTSHLIVIGCLPERVSGRTVVTINCPECGASTYVVRARRGKYLKFRRRECEGCGARFTTKEQIVPLTTSNKTVRATSDADSTKKT